MSNYSIQLLIDPADLLAIQASNRHITLARAVNDPHSPHVVWQSFAPDARTEVAWSHEYAIYAANTVLKHGAQILPTRSMPYPASPAGSYVFAADARFHGPYSAGGSVGDKQFCVHNEVPASHYPSLVFGLAQSAAINGVETTLCPLSARSILAHETAVFTPVNSVHIWLQGKVAPGTVQTRIPEDVTTVNFGRLINAQTLKYDAASDMFLPYSQVKRGFIFSMPNVIWPGSAGYALRHGKARRHAA